MCYFSAFLCTERGFRRVEKKAVVLLYHMSVLHRISVTAIVWIVVLTFAQLSSALTSSTTPTMPDSNRIFVGGISSHCTSQLLQESFAQYGSVEDIIIVGLDDEKRKNPFAFVSFDSPQSAASAISQASCEGLYQQVERVEPIDPSKRKRSNASRKKEQDDDEKMVQLCAKTNLIFQVQSTHVDRLAEYIESMQSEYNDLELQVEGSTSAVATNMSLLFLSVSNPTEMARRLSQDPIVSRALRKAYVVEKGVMEANLGDEAGREMIVNKLLQGIQASNQGDASERSFRVHAFPPSREAQIVSAFNKPSGKGIVLDPKHFTGILSIVQVRNYMGRGKAVNQDEFIMTGVSPSFVPVNGNNSDSSDDAVNRAYYKLKEAVGRYLREYQDVDPDIFNGAVALDCGCAPGGWTKFLADDMQCSLVYSIDPAELVIDLDNVQHIQMTIQDAMPVLKEKESKIKIWVSDMCLHAMEEQLDFLLLAKENGILEENAFFVLTLKCTTGYSKASFDGQAEKIVEKLASLARTSGTATYHLFSNRSGERTIMGFLL